MFCLLIQDENSSQKFFVMVQWKSKCSRDSSFWQNVHKGDWCIRYCSVFYIGTLSFFVYTVTVNGKEYIFFQSTTSWGYLFFILFWAEGGVRCLALNLFSYFDVPFKKMPHEKWSSQLNLHWKTWQYVGLYAPYTATKAHHATCK